MNCERVQDLLLPELAGELEPAAAAGLRRHLESCSLCAAAAKELAESVEMVESTLRSTIRAPSTLHDRVVAALSQSAIPGSNSPSRRAARLSRASLSRRRTAGAGRLLAATCLLVAGFAAGHWQAARNTAAARVPNRLPRPVLSLSLLGQDHREYLTDPHPAQVPGPDPKEVSQRMTRLLEFPVVAADLRSEGARLLGGRKCRLKGTTLAFLLYDWGGARVSLYQMDDSLVVLPPLREVALAGRHFQVHEAAGLTYVAWRSARQQFVMVAGLKPERLLRLARTVSSRSHNVS
jgi:anti-sigma factor RsiW